MSIQRKFKFADRVSDGGLLKILLAALSLAAGILIPDAAALAQPDIGLVAGRT